MTALAPAHLSRRMGPGAMVAGLGAAVAVRSLVSAGAGPGSPGGAVAFSALLTVVALASGWRPARPRSGWVGWGVLGAGVLLAGPLLNGAGWHPATGRFAGWAVVVTVVVTAEEALLRGALWSALVPRSGTAATVVATAVLFAVIHVPLYGLRALPLDLAAGLWLGVIRSASGTVAAPAAAHLLADWAGWWLA